MPEKDEERVAPVDDFHLFALLNGTDYMDGYIGRRQLQRIAATSDEVGLREAMTDVGDGDGKMTHVGLLTEAFQVMVLETLGGGISWGCA